MMKTISIMRLFCALIVIAAPTQTRAQSPESVSTNILSLDTVITEVLSNNPSLKAARANWEAMKLRVPQARAWEDARLGFDTSVKRFVSQPPNAMIDQTVMVEQPLPIAGKNRLRGDAATADAINAFEQFRRKQLDATAAARGAWLRLANAWVQLDLNRKNTALLSQFVEISRAKYESGSRSQADVLSAETALARLVEAAFDLRRDISEAETRLNVLMNRPVGTSPGRPAELTFNPVTLDEESVARMALEHRPEMIVAEKRIEAAEARLKAARKEWIPEPSFRVEGDRYNAASQFISEVGVGFSINLHWFNRAKYRSAIGENEKLVESARQEWNAVHSETAGMVHDQLKKVETFHHHTELFRSKLVPLAAQTVASKRTGYDSGQMSFLDLLEAQRDAQEVESMYWDHLMHYNDAVAELESMIGMNQLNSSTQTDNSPK